MTGNINNCICMSLFSWSSSKSNVLEASKTCAALVGTKPLSCTISNITSQIFPGPNDTLFHLLAPSSKSSNINGICKDKVIEAKKILLSCPEAKELWQEVENAGKFKLKCVSKDKVDAAGTDVYRREILFSKTFTAARAADKIAEALLFELNNLNYRNRGIFLDQIACELDRDSYAKGAEIYEYLSAEKTSDIMNRCIEARFWNDKIDSLGFRKKFLGENSLTIEEHLRQQDEYDHTDHYRLQWYKKCDPDGLVNWLKKKLV